MSIQAKASRQVDDRADDKTGAFTTGEKLSWLPQIMAGAIALVAFYFQGLFVAQNRAGQAEPSHKPKPSEDAPADEDAASSVTNRSAEPDGPAREDKAVVPASAFAGVEGRLWALDLKDIHSPVLFSKVPSFAIDGLAPFFPPAAAFRPSNDVSPPRPQPVVAPAPQAPEHSGWIARPASPLWPTDQRPTLPEKDVPEVPALPPAPDGRPINRGPVATGPVVLTSIFAGQSMLIGLHHLLSGAVDPDGDSLTAGAVSLEGGAVIASAGSNWLLSAPHGSLGTVTLTYTISDGLVTMLQTALVEIVRKQSILTSGDDVFVGSPYDDDIDGLAGNDLIDAMAGFDMVRGGAGDDHILGGAGDDHLYGGSGDDVLLGGDGDDQLFGGTGNDRLFGEDGNDILMGEEGADVLLGGAGDDIVDGGDGDDWLAGEDGADRLFGGAGADVMSGGDGADFLDGGEGHDSLDGGAGNDLLVGGAGDDSLDGGEGNDVLEGGAGDDALAGREGADILSGGNGVDTLDGGAGDDSLDGGGGDDIVSGGAGDDLLLAGAGSDILDGGEGDDTADYVESAHAVVIDTVSGTVKHGSETDTILDIENFAGTEQADIFILNANFSVSVRGRGGEDEFIFQLTDSDATMSEDVAHDILDFMIGDRIRVRDYDLKDRDEDAEEDFFEQVYGDDDPDHWLQSDLPFVVQYVTYDDEDHTIILADLDNDGVHDMTINIYGIHLPMNGLSDHA